MDVPVKRERGHQKDLRSSPKTPSLNLLVRSVEGVPVRRQPLLALALPEPLDQRLLQGGRKIDLQVPDLGEEIGIDAPVGGAPSGLVVVGCGHGGACACVYAMRR